MDKPFLTYRKERYLRGVNVCSYYTAS